MSLFRHFNVPRSASSAASGFSTITGKTIACPTLKGKNLDDTVLQGSPKRSSAIPRHASVDDSEEPFDPNDEFNKEAVSHWLSYSDFYHFPHIILFDSWQDAVDKLAAADLEDISRKMLQHSKAVEQELVTTWGKIFKDISKVQPRKPLSDVSYHERMNSLYGEGKWSDY